MQRIVRGSPGTITAAFTIDDQVVDLDATPSLTVTRADGSAVGTGSVAQFPDGTYAATVLPQDQLGKLYAEWTGTSEGGPLMTVQTTAEVVGSEYFSIAELRNSDPVLTNTTKYPDAKLRAARLAVESEFEGICGRSFVPRHMQERMTGDGTGRIWTSQADPLRLISMSVAGEDWSARTVRRPDWSLRELVLDQGIFPRGSSIDIEYEYGFAEVPVRIKNAALKRAKYALVADQSRIDERATTMNIEGFGNFVLATPGVRGSYTGIPEVDVVLSDYIIGNL